MKFLILFLFLYQVVLSQEPDFIRDFHSIKDEKEEVNFIKKYKISSSVSTRAYIISLQMKQAKYTWLPWNKISIFNKGKNELELLINEHPKNIHLRYIRLLIQEKVPEILGYYSSIAVDEKILNFYMSKEDETDYLDKYIRKNTKL